MGIFNHLRITHLSKCIFLFDSVDGFTKFFLITRFFFADTPIPIALIGTKMESRAESSVSIESNGFARDEHCSLISTVVAQFSETNQYGYERTASG